MSIKSNVEIIQNEIKKKCNQSGRNPKDITIIGVTKYVDNQVAKELLACGILNLGENRTDVFLEKYNEIGTHSIWHFIGNLQTRKVRDVINKIDYLHSLDRISLAAEINKHAQKKVLCFVQVNISGEAHKNGLQTDEVIDFIKQLFVYEKIEVVGLMTMALDTDDVTVIRSCFSELRRLQKEVENLSLMHAPCTQLSMGMTNDYKIAIAEGATFVRLGRCLIK